MRYLSGTRDYKILYRYGGGDLVGYSDSDWASDVDKRRSCTGYVFMMSDGAVAWASRRQPTVALSSTEAEYMALSAATCEAIWLRLLSKPLGDFGKPTTMFCDNQSAMAIADVEMFRARSKHIDTKYHHVRDVIKSGAISLKYVASKENAGDCLTKAIVGPSLILNVQQMGITKTKI